jgi:hypothetical protein
MTIEETVDEMQVAGTTASGADREPIRQVRLRASRKSRRFLVPHVNPLHLFVVADGVGESIERIPGQPIDPLHAAQNQRLKKNFRNSRHNSLQTLRKITFAEAGTRIHRTF